jgi:DNA-binding SARP family transcriptional activator
MDLGRVRLRVDTRAVDLSAMRRKPASLLMFLVTRPNHTATREQVLDELWPDNDPGSAANSLNQTLYFLRREIDPWYEDDVSTEYIPFEGDLVWLDQDLVKVESASFLADVRSCDPASQTSVFLDLLERYRGHFAPEFEYEEWAMAWRSRVQVAFLEFAHSAVSSLAERGHYAEARDAALHALEADPDARDVEVLLIALYWKLGARSAAKAQYAHYERRERDDGLEPPTFDTIVNEPLST